MLLKKDFLITDDKDQNTGFPRQVYNVLFIIINYLQFSMFYASNMCLNQMLTRVSQIATDLS